MTEDSNVEKFLKSEIQRCNDELREEPKEYFANVKVGYVNNCLLTMKYINFCKKLLEMMNFE